MTLALFAAAGVGYGATTYYVWTNSPSEGVPYDGWNNAAHAIQTAVNVAIAVGDTVLVTNGVYDVGGAVAPGTNALTNRVCVTTAITLRSMNGPEYTIIKGASSGGGCGANALRCVYLTNSAFLTGFTLTNGYTLASSDTYYGKSGAGIMLFPNTVVSNCVISGNTANQSGGGALLYYGGTMKNCALSGNTSGFSAGGALLWTGGVMSNCTISGNTSKYGGGIYCNAIGPEFYYCTIANNRSVGGGSGGGILFNQGGIMNNCTLSNNTSDLNAGGAHLYNRGTMNNCVLVGNMATNCGGGAYLETATSLTPKPSLKNCLLSGNISSTNSGGGVYLTDNVAISNCTFSGNTAANEAGGVYLVSTAKGTGAVNNCVIWGNNNASSSNIAISGTALVNYTCSGPVQLGTGNIGGDPLFVDTNGNYHLMVNSSCINAGVNSAWMTNTVDLDNRQRIRYGTVDMGAYETIYNGTIYRIP